MFFTAVFHSGKLSYFLYFCMPAKNLTGQEEMIIRSTYKAAGIVSSTVEAHFGLHINEARNAGETDLAPVPLACVVESVIDAAFWASLRKEEGRSPRISLAWLPPHSAGYPLVFGSRLPLLPDVLTKLAPGVEPAGIHLGVWHDGDELYIWGTTRALPSYCFVLEIVEPGLLVVKHRRFHGYGKFVNVAILKGDQVKVVDEQSGSMPDCPALLTSLLGFTGNSNWNDSVNVLIQLATSMRAHNRGGTLLVVPNHSDQWRESIIHPIIYSVVPAFGGLTELMQKNETVQSQAPWLAALSRAIESVAGLTAVDGATIINDKHELLAFGAKIGRAEGSTPVEKVILTEPILGGEANVVHPNQNGGTRHLSAAQFVYDQRDSIALVASQDGRFTIFGWSPCEGMVHAHRVDSLLL